MRCAERPNDEENKNNPEGIIVMGVNIHCEGCANEVKKCLRGFEGVEGIQIDAKNNKVSVKGKNADPIKVMERLRKKSGKHVELISPRPHKEDKIEDKIRHEPEVIEVVLKIYIHCESCAKEVKNCILKMEGVERVEVNMEKNLVSVKGKMDPDKVVELIMKRGGRHAEIVIANKGNENKYDASSICCTCYHHYYNHQLFSDENPNSCSFI